MAVLIEAISVLIRRSTIDERFPGGWGAFLDDRPNRTLYSDGEIASVSFMMPSDAEDYIFYLESCGLDCSAASENPQIAIVDQIRGFMRPTRWAEFGEVEMDGHIVKGCWLTGADVGHVFTPRGWSYKGSLSEKPGFVAAEDTNSVRFLREENGLEVYLDLRTNKEVFVGRPGIRGESRKELFDRLSAMCQETLHLDVEADFARAESDEEAGARIFDRLQDDLLPQAMGVVEGIGRSQAFAHFTCGLILRVLLRHAEAETYFHRANELQPGVTNTLLELVRCLGEQGKNDEALPFAREAVNLEPDSPDCLGNLASCLFQTGARTEALEHLKKALQINPHDPINREILRQFGS